MVAAALLFAALSIAGCGGESPSNTGGSNSFIESPNGISAEWHTDTQVILRWRDRSNNEDGFKIYESIDDDTSFVVILTTAANVDSILIPGRNPETVYFYKVRAYTRNNFSDYTETVRIGGGYLYRTLGPLGGPMLSVAFSPLGAAIATGNGDNRVRIWTISTATEYRRFPAHSHMVTSLCFSPGGGRLASNAADDIRIWNVNTSEEILSLDGREPAFSPNGEYIALAKDSSVYILNASTFDTVSVYRAELNVDARIFGWTNQNKLAVGLHNFRIVDPAGGPQLQKEIFLDKDTRAAISRSGEYLAIGGGSGTIRLRKLSDTTDTILSGGSGKCYSLAFSPSDSLIAAGWADWRVRIWNLSTGAMKNDLTGHEYIPYQVAWSVDGDFLASASGDRTVRIWGPFK